MSAVFRYETGVRREWIDYNGHMRDAYYGLVFSYAVDAFQDEVGLDAAYRKRTGCTVYLVEDHCFYLAEVKEGDLLVVETRVIGSDARRFHLHLTMLADGILRAVCEFMELHVRQTPEPKAAEMPAATTASIAAARLSQAELAALPRRSRAMGLAR